MVLSIEQSFVPTMLYIHGELGQVSSMHQSLKVHAQMAEMVAQQA